MISHGISTAQLCVFRVPGLDGHEFAVTLSEVLVIGSLDRILPVPFSPDYSLGLSVWQKQLVTVVDLAAALLGTETPADLGANRYRHLISQTLWGQQNERVAWPIMDGTESLSVQLDDVRLSSQSLWKRDLIYSTIHVQDRMFHLINTTGFVRK